MRSALVRTPLWWPFPLRWPLIHLEFAPPRTLRILRLLSRTNARTNPGQLLFLEILRAIISDVLPAVGRCVSAGSVARGTFRLRPALGLAGGLLVERLFGDPEGVDCSRHPAVENHLGDYLGDFLLSYADIQGPGDVPLDHLGAVAQHHQRGDGAQAAGAEVNRRPVVNLAVDHRVDQAHNVGRQFQHGSRGMRVVVRAVVAHPEFRSGLFEVDGFYIIVVVLVILQIDFTLYIGLIRTLKRVIFVVVFGGHCSLRTA